MPTGSPSRHSMALCAVVCGRCCAGRSTDRAKDDAYAITYNGRTPSSPLLGCSRCPRPINRRANPDVETTDWRALRGKTAHRVRREGTVIAVSYPYTRRTSCAGARSALSLCGLRSGGSRLCAMKVKDLIALLEADGWFRVRMK